MSNKGFGTGFALGALAGGLAAFLAYKNRRDIKAVWWKWQAKADIHRRLAALKELTRDSYDEVIDDVLMRYETVEGVAADEMRAFAADLKSKYQEIKARLSEID